MDYYENIDPYDFISVMYWANCAFYLCIATIFRKRPYVRYCSNSYGFDLFVYRYHDDIGEGEQKDFLKKLNAFIC